MVDSFSSCSTTRLPVKYYHWPCLFDDEHVLTFSEKQMNNAGNKFTSTFSSLLKESSDTCEGWSVSSISHPTDSKLKVYERQGAQKCTYSIKGKTNIHGSVYELFNLFSSMQTTSDELHQFLKMFNSSAFIHASKMYQAKSTKAEMSEFSTSIDKSIMKLGCLYDILTLSQLSINDASTNMTLMMKSIDVNRYPSFHDRKAIKRVNSVLYGFQAEAPVDAADAVTLSFYGTSCFQFPTTHGDGKRMFKAVKRLLQLMLKMLTVIPTILRRRRFGNQSFLLPSTPKSQTSHCDICFHRIRWLSCYTRSFGCRICGATACSSCCKKHQVEQMSRPTSTIGECFELLICVRCVTLAECCIVEDATERSSSISSRSSVCPFSINSQSASTKKSTKDGQAPLLDDLQLLESEEDIGFQVKEIAAVLTDMLAEAATDVNQQFVMELIQQLKRNNYQSPILPYPKDKTNLHFSEANGYRSYRIDYQNYDYLYPKAPIPVNEKERIEFLNRTALLDTTREPLYDFICATATRELKCPIATISLIASDFVFIKASHGIPDEAHRIMQRDAALCSYGIMTSMPFVIKNPLADLRFRNNPMVTDLHVRFYLGFPLLLDNTQAIGVLCVMDTRKHESVSPKEYNALKHLAATTMQLIESRQVLQHQTGDYLLYHQT